MTTRACRRIDFAPTKECRSHVCMADGGLAACPSGTSCAASNERWLVPGLPGALGNLPRVGLPNCVQAIISRQYTRHVPREQERSCPSSGVVSLQIGKAQGVICPRFGHISCCSGSGNALHGSNSISPVASTFDTARFANGRGVGWPPNSTLLTCPLTPEKKL
jgi:hypothetical protein